jgi:hypothetical protein
LPFVNSLPLTTTLAWVNRSGLSQEVTLIARGVDGAEKCRDTRQLAAGAHESFIVGDRLLCSRDSLGVLQIEASGDGIAATGFFFHSLGPFTTNLPIVPGSIARGALLPQIAAGTGFTTDFQLFDLADVSERAFALEFADSEGEAMELDLQDAGSRSGLEGVVPAGGAVFQGTLSAGDVRSGYASQAVGSGLLAVNALYTQEVPGRPPFQASIPLLSPAAHARLPFSNVPPLTTSLAWVNAGAEPKDVQLTARDESGAELCSATARLAGGAHEAFVVRDRLTCTAGRQGLLEIQADGEGVPSIGFYFHDAGPFTSLLPAACPNCSGN